MENVWLSEKQIKMLLNLVENARFDGKFAFEVFSLLNQLKEGLQYAHTKDDIKNNRQ